MKEIYQKLNEMTEAVHMIDKKVDVHTHILDEIRVDLNYHIKRTDQVEHTLLAHVAMVETAIKILKWSVPVVGTIIGLYLTYLGAK